MPPDPVESAEEVDLDAATRDYVLGIHGRLKALSHYEVLGIPREADKKAVKRAYFNAVGMIHPDRYFGKKLGSFKPKMEAIFARITEAYETLLAPDRRARYDAALGQRPSGPAPAGAPVPKAPVDPRVAAQQKAAMDALKQRHLEGKAKAREHAEMGHRARANHDYAAAAGAYRLALGFAPGDATLKAALEETQRASEAKLAESLERQALLEERHGHWAEAAESWRRVSLARPGDPTARDRMTAALAHAARGAGSKAP